MPVSNVNGSWAVQKEEFRYFPQLFYENVGVVSQLGQDCVHPNPFNFFSHRTVWHCISWKEIPAVSLHSVSLLNRQSKMLCDVGPETTSGTKYQ